MDTLDREIANLAEAIARTGPQAPLLDALTARQTQRSTLGALVASQVAVEGAQADRAEVERKVRARLSLWRAN